MPKSAGYWRDCVDDYLSISINKFMWRWSFKKGAYPKWKITRSRGWEVTSTMWYTMRNDDQRIDFDFIGTNWITWEKNDYVRSINLVTTECNYGWFKYRFLCPKCLGKKWCLYMKNFSFACRKCLNLCYEYEKRSKKSRFYDKIIPHTYEAEKLYKTIKYKYWKGKPTRKYRRYLRLMKAHISYEEEENIMKHLWNNKQ